MKAMKIGTVASALLLASTMQVHAATEIYENHNSYDAPDASAMVMDAWIAKPLQTVMVAGGAATWLVSLPFTLVTNTQGDSWQKLVAEPAGNLTRCLGCTDLQDQNRLAYEYRNRQRSYGNTVNSNESTNNEFDEW